jgi:hypothetical protein
MIFLTAKKNRSRKHKKGVLYFSIILGLSVIASVLPFVEVENKFLKRFLDNSQFLFPLILIACYSLAFNYTFKSKKPGSHKRSRGKMTAINR